MGNVLLTKEITRQYTDKGIISVAVHPGVIKTALHSNINTQNFFTNLLLKFTPKEITEDEVRCNRFICCSQSLQGAYTQVFAATHPRVISENLNGCYLIPFGKNSAPTGDANNAQLAQKLWEYLDAEVSAKMK